MPWHFELASIYAEDFYRVAPELVRTLDRQRSESFLFGLCPVVRGSPTDKAAL